MAIDNTYQAIATTTLGSATASVTFSSISGSYTDLVLVSNFYETAANGAYIQVGNTTVATTNYSETIIRGDGVTVFAERYSSGVYAGLYWDWQGSSTNPGAGIANFQNYSNTSTFKTILMRYGNGTNTARMGLAMFATGLWRSTAAINIITIVADSTTFPTGTTFTLYGIKAA